ncbi:hypothetical protein AK812_SmicGene36841 [Symbiodinium microadriaticum]|uniref:Uncharacterized protein n=1 Tax=Symbiodinium microadriaticum TaxID=2951 RepID=A0A1Q9CHU8_SYMMI|nr:hypothetical protein AK812_SmicGene36841 [Symbiodinium microadriaticum]
MDSGHRAHSLCMLSTAVAIHQDACVCLWSFLLPGERRYFIAACRELDFYCLKAVRHAGLSLSSITMAASLDGASDTEAGRLADLTASRWLLSDLPASSPVPGPLVRGRRRAHRERFPLARLVGCADVFRDGELEMQMNYHGALTMSEFLTATAETCSRTGAGWFHGWQVANVAVYLRRSVAMPAFGASLEETTRQALYIAFRAMGGFAKRFARRRRQGRAVFSLFTASFEAAWYQGAADVGEQSEMALKKPRRSLKRGHDFAFPFQLPLVGRADMFAEIASEDQLRAAALARIKEVVLFDPGDSRLGRSLLESSGLLIPEHQLATVLSDTFARKATSTLAKRSCDFLKFSRWQVQVNSAKPLRASEQDLYKYVCHLRDSAAAPTSLAAFISSWRFFHHMVGSEADPAIVSQRVEGAAHTCYLRKAPLKQATPLTVPLVQRLEDIVLEGNDVYAVIAGFALFCLFSAARWSDAAKADDQMTFMPLIALGHTFRDSPWATAWIAARARAELDSKSVLMPAFAEQNRKWLDRPMTSAEGCSWLQEILHGDEFDEDMVAKVTTHALKATPLSWATKCGRFDKHEKRILGHHSSPDERMIVTYGRDVMCPVLAKLQNVIDLIRAGRFDPDRTRAERMSTMVMRLNEQAEIDVQPERRVEDLRRLEESEQSDVSLEDHKKLNEHPSLVPGLQADPEPPETGSYVRHKVSLIVHIVLLPASLLRCGRPLNHNYEDCSYNPDQPREDILCEQCKSARASV